MSSTGSSRSLFVATTKSLPVEGCAAMREPKPGIPALWYLVEEFFRYQIAI